MKVCFFQDKEFACVTEDIMKEKLTKNVAVHFRIFPQQEIKKTRISLSKCTCALFVRVTVYSEPDTSFSYSKTLTQIQKPHGPFCSFRLRLLSFIKKFRIPNFHKR
jgi:hypothetical protein